MFFVFLFLFSRKVVPAFVFSYTLNPTHIHSVGCGFESVCVVRPHSRARLILTYLALVDTALPKGVCLSVRRTQSRRSKSSWRRRGLFCYLCLVPILVFQVSRQRLQIAQLSCWRRMRGLDAVFVLVFPGAGSRVVGEVNCPPVG